MLLFLVGTLLLGDASVLRWLLRRYAGPIFFLSSPFILWRCGVL
ncbi:hypothetical protein [Cryptosporangium arvum]|uniref:Uncharacterized protein n=1 Tax=Cryptosporangium arvum DSM 44712 TaxID=927661 RepID=A0A010YQ21_9ACTN|nr:hypothetical protein CryarDRAFT_3420 [Cryptosporangium arvum DSM 44712]